MPTCGNFKLIKVLGKGGFGVVYFGKHIETNEKAAIKIIQNYDFADHLELIETEVEALKSLSHINITKILDSGISELKTSSKSKEVYFIALELAHGGELFDFLMLTEPFTEKVARFFFHQLIEGLEHMHSKGYSHRDIKAENILFDKDFNLKIADFGTSSNILMNKTTVGTKNFMAPEVLACKPYHGQIVDIFGAGLVLFLMVTGRIPFESAEQKDYYYKYLHSNRPSKFWSLHFMTEEGEKGEDYLSDDIKSLISNLLDPHPIRRFSLSEIKAHPWYEGEVPSHEEIIQEFKARKEIKEEKETENAKLSYQETTTSTMYQDSSVLEGTIFRGIGISDDENEEVELNRECIEFDPDFTSHTKFYSNRRIDDLWYCVAKFVKNYTKDVTFSSTEYNMVLRWIDDSGDEELSDSSEIINEASINILKMGDEDKYCVELILLNGSKPEFFEFYKNCKNHFLQRKAA
ncbi:unnamed protein product [Moneuplotes crassus]|uniref:non-specific serine/threonine protein kinase n=1 Tax=Euplotes crassus TaxID=5936 RepID=A0AAD1U2S9_EUPCR|nr:unnamed protein product [Moneuplotes crassus]